MQQLQGVQRDTCRMQDVHGRLGHARRLLSGFGQHRVAGGQCRGHLARKNCEREIPRADTDPDTACREAQRVGLTRHAIGDANLRAVDGGAGNGLHDALGFIRVVAQKVHRLTHLGHRVAPGLERFLD